SSRVRWVARESPSYGFDVLSFFGLSHGKSAPDKQLAVEVKANALIARGTFLFFLTEHEWSTACKLGKRYVLHLWDGVTPAATVSAARDTPIIVKPATLARHLPQPPNCRELCGWRSTFVVVAVK